MGLTGLMMMGNPMEMGSLFPELGGMGAGVGIMKSPTGL
ncbi:hypothetical protein CWATWH0402_6143 [Crocosphaera watsonii WH 0402]|uniref:Uncharacterized protein n=2 Tax=Crocosphaera watsonii TaxID=263511 RepID=T2JXJ0_CROWT|nr:hypothetical protein CWATWH0005_2787 [Crocosphaera watsonii WH 0005]CCQ69920.1 hypothetical protein CWATWH0402_6143 [Crocosphaera watsonii WH 0402]